MKSMYKQLIVFILLLAALVQSATAQQVTATFIHPTDGAVNVDLSKPFQWTSVSGALSYYLYVGTAVGASDLVNSGETQLTSYTVPPLPTNQTLHARIWTRASSTGNWTYADITFTAAPATAPGKAAFINPTNGAVNVETSKPFQWTTASGAQGYYLYVGTAQGKSDLVNSGETQLTSYNVPALPSGQTLWARIWTKLNGTWTAYSDVSFTAAVGKATFLYPTNNAQNVDTSKSFQWTGVPAAQGYYLYVGTTQGSKDLVNSGALQQTSYAVPPLPPGQVLWARIYTKLNDTWTSYADISFTAAAGKATFLYPTNNAQNVDTSKPFQWTGVPGAQGYYLYVGTTQGKSDLVNSGELPVTQTSFAVPALPVGSTLWARIWTKTDNSWVKYSDVSFTAAAGKATFSHPRNGAVNIDTRKPFQWTTAPGAQGYYLWVGTAQGRQDLVNSGALSNQQTSYAVPPLPAGQTLWARLYTKSNNSWVLYSEVSFSSALAFVYPVTGATGVDGSKPFQWTPVAVVNGQNPTYTLSIGTTAGASDLFSNNAIQQSSYAVPSSGLPLNRTLYARVRARSGDGTIRYADCVFMTQGAATAAAQMTYPLPGSTDVDVSNPFQWVQQDMAGAYRLQIYPSGNTGSTALRDSGLIRVPRYFITDLPLGSYTGRLSTLIGNQWSSSDFNFSVIRNGSVVEKEIASAQWAANFVRDMADANNYPYSWAELFTNVTDSGRFQALCSDYRDVLLLVLKQMNVTAQKISSQQPRRLDIAFTVNGDTHTLVEFYNSADGSWILLDPTFALTMKRASDGRWATKEDMQRATLAQNWSAISYVFLGSHGESIARGYYLDYPLLYVNTLGAAPSTGNDPMPYLQQVSPMPTNRWGTYMIKSSQSPVNVLVDNQVRSINCNLSGSLSAMLLASTIAAPAGGTTTFEVYKPLRHVF